MWTKIWSGVLLVSLVGLGFAINQQIDAEQAMESKIEAKLKSAFPYLQQASDGLLEEMQKQAYGYSQFIPLEEKAFALDRMTTKQLLSIDKTGQFDNDSLDYKPFFTRDRDYLEMQYHFGISNSDSISNSLIGSKLQPTISKILLLNTKIKLLNYLYGHTGVTNCFGSFVQLSPVSSNNLVELGTIFQSKIIYRNNFVNDGYKYNIFINGKPSVKRYGFEYKTTPTQIGKHEYHIEVKDRSNKTVFEDTHHFFVGNCKTNNHD